ncbi:hypothetical protein RV01_GL001854 [Enterococcus dispar]|nr:hypothetical protein RV01_GL001854 [Enterococcus dispar]
MWHFIKGGKLNEIKWKDVNGISDVVGNCNGSSIVSSG